MPAPAHPGAVPALAELARTALHLAAGPDHVMRAAVERVAAVLHDRCSAWLHETDVVVANQPDPVTDALRRGYAPAGAEDAAVPVMLDAPWLAGYGLAQCVLLPIRDHARELGVLAVTRSTGRARFTPADIELLTAIADVTGAVVAQQRMLSDCLAALDDMRQLVEVVDHVSEALVSCDAMYQIVSWNAGAEDTYGYPRDEAVGCDLFALLGTQFYTRDGIQTVRERVLAELAETGTWQGELRQRRADGAPLIIMASLTNVVDADGAVTGLVAVNRDITAQRHDEHRAMHDPLTGLPNRRLLNAELYEAYARACRTRCTLAVVFIDLDGFKAINDTRGHASGDIVLKATADRLIAVLRNRDTVARLGGDEFVVILEEAGNLGAVESVARRVADALAVPIDLDGSTVGVGASIGVAVLESPEANLPVSAESMLAAADQAMYIAKRRNCGVWIADPEMLVHGSG